MSWRVRYTAAARDDIKRLYDFLLDHDIMAAQHALTAIVEGVDILRQFPFAFRKVDPGNPLLRELLVSFGASGYVLAYEIENEQSVVILAVRHQREDDYH